MAEQISHIKSLKKLDNDKRKLLKEYYRLQKTSTDDKPQYPSQNQEVAEPDGEQTSYEPSKPEEERQNPEDLDLEGNLDIPNKTLKELLQIQNILLTRETEADNNIKNTIYDNYYDLIKVDKTLLEVSQLDETLLDQLKETCSMAKML